MSSAPVAPARANLQRLFTPSSVAVVGASTTVGKVGYQAVLALADFPGEVFPVNPKAEEVLGHKAFPSLRAVGHPVDLVVFALPAAGCVEAVREAVECNAGGGVILSSGFAESGADGQALQHALRELCAQSGFRLLGPNTAGFINRKASLTASFVGNADRIAPGDIAIVAQSAGVNFTLCFLLEQLGSGVSLAVGLGNAVDIGAAEVLEFLADHAGTKVIALHLEGIPKGRSLYDVIRRVVLKKPVVALTVGKEEIGEFARSHTGNLIGSYEVRRNALLQAGAVVVKSTEELAQAAAVLAAHRLAAKRLPGVGVLTGQAGPALLMLDKLKASGVSVPELTERTLARIKALLPPTTYLANPVDTGRPGPSFPQVLQALAEDERIHVVVTYALHEPATLLPTEVLPSVASRVDKPILFGTMGPAVELQATITALRKQGIFVAKSPEQLAQAALVLAKDAEQQARASLELPAIDLPEVELPSSSDEHAIKRLLAALGIGTPEGIAVASHEEARTAFRRLAKPVAVKILSEEIAHKTEVRGVHLDVADEASLDVALGQLDTIALRGQRRYLLEPMAPPGLELLIGCVRDASFGPTVTVGLGGVLAEALKDTATRLAPLTLAEAEEMLDELRAAPLFDGWRGSPKLDRGAVARTIVTLGAFMCRQPSVVEIEINPLRVYAEGVLALDAQLTRR